jgi:NAD(P)-dependent dehydrogenase (short-subunit alcohol dehydrogenase family)
MRGMSISDNAPTQPGNQLRHPKGQAVMDIAGHQIWITGGGSGLGLACARHFAAAGGKVTIFDLDQAGAQVHATDIGAAVVKLDVGEEATVEGAVNAAVAAAGAPRVLVNCAGIGLAARIVGRDQSLSTGIFEKTIRINLIGTYLMMSHVARAMLAADTIDGTDERGVIINTASVAWQDGQVGQAAYAASKGGVASLCLPAARELGQFGIRVMTIAPGLFETPMTDGLPNDLRDAISANIPFPSRLGLAEEYALLAAQIVGNPYLNGTVIRLDGALRLPRK